MNNIVRMEIRKANRLEEFPESVFVEFDYSIKAVSKMKKIPDKFRRYIADKKCWEVSLAHLNELLELYSDFEIVITGKAFTEPPQLRTVFQDNSLDEFNFKTEPFPHQIQGVLFGKNHDKFLLADEQGLGKAQPMYSNVLTPNGWTKMGDIKLGDEVIGKDGKSHNVVGVFPQGVKPIYEINFSDGSRTRCSDEHLWKVYPEYARERVDVNRRHVIVDTNELIELVKRTRVNIPMVEPVHFNEQDVLIDPYVMGCLLGDGGFTNNGVSFTSEDGEIIEEIIRRLPEGYRLSKYTDIDYGIVRSVNTNGYKGKYDLEAYDVESGELLGTFENSREAAKWVVSRGKSKTLNCYYYLTAKEIEKAGNIKYGFKWKIIEKKLSSTNKVIDALIRYDLHGKNSGNKFIPNCYLYNTVEVRLSVLRGLMDTDGYVSKDGTIQFTSISNRLAYGVRSIVESLGGIARLNERENYRVNGEEKVKGKNVFELTINLPDGICPFLLSRKADRVKKNKKYKPKRFINSITFTGLEECQCISVDAPDSLYVTDEYIVTHNTKQAIDLAVSRKGQFKHCLIVCGVNSVKYNWLKEIGIHSDESGHILGSYIDRNGKLRDDGPMEYRLDDLNSDLDEFFLITNIETFRKPDGRRKESALSKMELTQKRIIERVEQLTRDGVIGMVIIDEVHKAKNPTSQQGKAIHHLKPHYKMALTGTPVMNSPLDVYNILKWLEVEHHPFHQFKKYYTESSNTWGDQLVFKNLSRLQELLDSVMLRRKKGDVLDLPPKLPQVIELDMKGSQQKLYKGIRDELITKVEEIVLNPNPLAMLTRLRQVTSLPQVLTDSVKESAKLEWVEEMLETMVENGQKAIIFSNWSAITRAVQERLKHLNPAYIDGTVKDRMEQVEKFQGDPNCHVIIGTIGAMGTGLTLTAASNVIFIDEPWNPADKDQAEDRAHRIGTKGTVNIYTLVIRNSVDHRIRDLIMHKQDIIDGMVEGNFDKLNAIQFIKELLA